MKDIEGGQAQGMSRYSDNFRRWSKRRRVIVSEDEYESSPEDHVPLAIRFNLEARPLGAYVDYDFIDPTLFGRQDSLESCVIDSTSSDGTSKKTHRRRRLIRVGDKLDK